MLFKEGLQVPVMLLVEVVGSAGIEAPAQYGPTEANVGVTLEFTDMVIVVEEAHSPAFGVNEYTVEPAEEVEIVEGLHDPEIPLVEVEGNEAGVLPTQYGPSWTKAGVTIGLIVIVSVVVVAH